MRTTLNIDDDVYRQAKAYAALEGCSVTSVVEAGLRALLADAGVGRRIADMPVSRRGGGLTEEFTASGVDLADTSAVLDFLDQPSA